MGGGLKREYIYRIQGYNTSNNIPGLPIHVFLHCSPSPRISHTKVEFIEDDISTEDCILRHLTTKEWTEKSALNYEIKNSLLWQQKFDDCKMRDFC